MAPNPEKAIPPPLLNDTKTFTGEEVVISGMSGIFPSSDSVKDFMDNLYKNVDMVTLEEDLWIDHSELPKHYGKAKGMTKFDAQFFKVHYKQARCLDPSCRKILEHAFSAIYDSGINPMELRGKKVAVYIGTSSSELEKTNVYESFVEVNGFALTGVCRSMYANRISYWLDLKGPSYSLDQTCSSVLACLEHAYRGIKNGEIEAAIIGGTNYTVHPYVALSLKRGGYLCMDGKTKCFDKNGDGFVKADSINAFFLQKSKDAKRIYSEVYSVNENYKLMDEEIYLPLREVNFLTNFFNETYSNIDVVPENIEYIEAFAAGFAKADSNELEAIGKIFGKHKTVKVGSVKSNMGHAETASGGSSLAKVCLAYYKGEIPANLHYENPPDHIPGLKDGKIQVVTTNTPFNRGFAAINSFSYTGSNFHVILKGHYKKKNRSRYMTNLPYLVFASGRQEECVSKLFENLKSNPIDPEQIGLLHNIHSTDIAGHMCRGYVILAKDANDDNTTLSKSENIEYYPAVTQPIWFVYSGMGSQWVTMGAELMRIPIFAAAIEKCRNVLEPRGVDIVKILTANDKTIYDNILNSFVGIAAVQIGLTDILNALGIVPDNIIGHSVGELGCAYADGCFTAEEMILAAYSRGLVSVQTPLIRGSMAAVGLGYGSVLPLCPPEIEVACHNSSESSTISGPADNMKQFVSELTSRGVFAKEVPCSNIAYHSRYIADAGPQLLKYLSEVIIDPKPRSDKWVSTSVPQDKWNEPMAKYSSAEYHTNNLLNSVLFEETSKLIPSNAIVIEIAPHGLLQAIIKRSLPDCTHIPLTRRGHSDPVKLLFESFGRLYQAGLNPKVQALYPQIQFPVSTETQMLSHLVGWEHSEDWPLSEYDKNFNNSATAIEREIVVSIFDDDYSYFSGHIRDGLIVVPEAALLVFVWETLAMSKGVPYNELSVVFSDVQFYGEIIIQKELPFEIIVMIYKGSQNFEVCYEQSRVVRGNIRNVKNIKFRTELKELSKDEETFRGEDIYKVMHLKGFNYTNEFQSLLESNSTRDTATVKWSKKWVPLLDSLIQFNAFMNNHDGISVPKSITQLTIDTGAHFINQIKDHDNIYHQIVHNPDLKRTRCGGVEMDGLVLKNKSRSIQIPDVIQTKSFVPHFLIGQNILQTALHVNMQIIKENTKNKIVKLTQLIANSYEDISKLIEEVSYYIPSFDLKIISVPIEENDGFSFHHKDNDAFVIHNFLINEKNQEQLHKCISKHQFIIAIEQNLNSVNPYNSTWFTVISAMTVGKQVVVLLKKKEIKEDDNITYISIVDDNTYSWVPRVQTELKKSKRVVLVSGRENFCDLTSFLQKVGEEYFDKLSLIIVDEYRPPSFNLAMKNFKEQVKKNLRINILNEGKWGGYYFVPSEISVKLLNFKLASINPGDLDSLKWIEDEPECTKQNFVKVCYAGLSQSDVIKAVGLSKSISSGLGLDFSGIDVNGDKVMGISLDGTISSIVKPIPELQWPVPQNWSLEDAATVPFPYIMAYYCLAIKSNIHRGSSVFVTGGAGALGQAVISICLALDCTIYTTVSDIKKKRFLLDMFPKLPENNIGCSRDDAFHNMVIHNSKNKRCDIVINCSSGLIRESTMKTVGFGGYIYDLSDQEMVENKNIGMNFLNEERNYVGIQLSHLLEPKNKIDLQLLQSLIAEGIAKGIVRPLSHVVYSPVDVTKAFRLVSATRHRGRVLINMNDPLVLGQGLQAIPKMSYSNKGSYVVICNDNNFGIEVADRLVRNGARNIIMNFNERTDGYYLSAKSIDWRNLGAKVNLSLENVKTENGCEMLLKESLKLGPVDGIFIVLNKDDEAETVDEKKPFINKDKVLPVINLDMISRKICPELKYFVVLMRTSQNVPEAYKISVVENICHIRNHDALPASSVQIRFMDEFNSTVDDTQSKLQPLPLLSVLNGLDISLKLKQNNVTMYNLKKDIHTDLMPKLENILGLKSIDEVDEEMILGDFLLNDMNFCEIKTAIEKMYQISYSIEKIKNMSIKSLKNINHHSKKQNTKFNSGLEAFYTYIDDDENVASSPMIIMPTLLNTTPKDSEDVDPNKTYLLLIPGFEGHYQMFTSLCKRVKINARVFQLGPDVSTESIPIIAEDMMTFIKERFEFRSKFYLMGYSFGVNVALELAYLLEKEGHVGVVYCLDSSPTALPAQLDAYLGKLPDSEIQNAILHHIYSLMTGTNNNELREQLKLLETWNEKIETCLQRLKLIVHFSNEYKRAIFESAYRKIKLAQNYEPDFKLKSQIVLMKGVPHPDQEELSDDYDLSKYSTRPIQVFKLASDHALAPEDCRVSNIINNFIDTRVLEELKKQNLCEKYSIAAFPNIF